MWVLLLICANSKILLWWCFWKIDYNEYIIRMGVDFLHIRGLHLIRVNGIGCNVM